MLRESIERDLKYSSDKNIVLCLPTSFGKTKIALGFASNKLRNNANILVVVPQLVLIDSWKVEIEKYLSKEKNFNFTFSTYVSLHKHISKRYDAVIYDECHHLSTRCKEILWKFNIEYNIFVSATISRELEGWLNCYKRGIKFVRVSVKEAIKDSILPDPRIILVPLYLDCTNVTEEFIMGKKDGKPIECSFADRFKFIKNCRCTVKSTQYQKNKALTDNIEFFKSKTYKNPIFKGTWMRLCIERLKWLASIKTNAIKNILSKLSDYRVLTFCSSIEQSVELGEYCINSKNNNRGKYLNEFNDGKINHITAVDMLNEGVNLVNCQIGIFGIINGSDRLQIQKIGRILRHSSPIIIIPYYKNTREEEIVKELLESYSKNNISICNDINNIKI